MLIIAKFFHRTTRKEFTSEDDDLIIRYIAVVDPEKKRMTSRSFYNEMVNSITPPLTVDTWMKLIFDLSHSLTSDEL